MVEENISPEFKLKNIEVTRICFIKEIDKNKLISKSRKIYCIF